ncbi:hypothetical protein KM043_010005 [Ampulex compressa]|nr:hypothetical protein KM043_010005 [Ampulex compressa]
MCVSIHNLAQERTGYVASTDSEGGGEGEGGGQKPAGIKTESPGGKKLRAHRGLDIRGKLFAISGRLDKFDTENRVAFVLIRGHWASLSGSKTPGVYNNRNVP